MLELLREMLEGVPFVPEQHIAYRPLLIDGMLFFLERLGPERLNEIVEQQMLLPEATSDDERFIALLRLCPTLHKLGQVVARERGLSLELRVRLQTLESLPPTLDLAEVVPLVERELGNALSVVEPAATALAEGSVAVVIPCVWRDGTGSKRGVIKVLKPGVEARMTTELELAPALGDYLEERSAHYALPVLPYRTTLDGVRRLLLSEIRLDLEQQHLARAAMLYAASPEVVVPALFPFSTTRMTVMERIDGEKVTGSHLPVAEKRRLAENVVDALVAQPFWSTADATAFFHADPHAGNLFVAQDGRLAILDWALTTELTKTQRSAIVRAMLSAVTLDELETVRAIAALGRVSDAERLRAAVADALRAIRGGAFPGFEWLTGLLDRLGREAALEFPEETALFRKSLLTLSGVLQDISEAASLDGVLLRSGVMQFTKELGGRPFAPLDSRNFGSNVSNADLLSAGVALPWLPARYWLGTWRDTLEAFARVP